MFGRGYTYLKIYKNLNTISFILKVVVGIQRTWNCLAGSLFSHMYNKERNIKFYTKRKFIYILLHTKMLSSFHVVCTTIPLPRNNLTLIFVYYGIYMQSMTTTNDYVEFLFRATMSMHNSWSIKIHKNCVWTIRAKKCLFFRVGWPDMLCIYL